MSGKGDVKLTSSDPIQIDKKYIISLCNILPYISDDTIGNSFFIINIAICKKCCKYYLGHHSKYNFINIEDSRVKWQYRFALLTIIILYVG